MGSCQYLEIDGRLNFVESHGEGRPVFCVHTAGQHGFQYRRAALDLAERGFRAIVVDLPGHGRSDPAQDGPINDLGWYADWCIDVLHRLEVSEPLLLGCSIGGKIVLDMATKISTQLAGVVSMAAYGQRGGKGRSARPFGLEDSGSPSNRERSYYGHAALLGRSVEPETVQLIATMHAREDWQVTVSDQTGWSRHDIWDDLPAIKCPTYLVSGSDDFGVPFARVRATAARIPGCRAVELPDIGHYPMQEMPDFADRFVAWIGELDADRVATTR